MTKVHLSTDYLKDFIYGLKYSQNSSKTKISTETQQSFAIPFQTKANRV